MSRQYRDRSFGALRGLYRDRENGWIFGVCAGLAERFNLNLGAVRVVAVVSLVFAFWATGIIYLAATLLIREKPLVYSGVRTEHDFWRRYDSDYWERP